jgi:hypothetical protein
MLKVIFQKMRRNTIFVTLLVVIVTGCSECDLEKELNNFTSTPTEHIYQIAGSEVATALKIQNNNSNCDPPSGFTARVKITVRTASVDANNTVTIDPNPYHEIDDDFTFERNTGFNNPNAKILVKVPEKGAYAILMEFELPDCSNCCNGNTTTIHCSSVKKDCVNFDCKCESGKPKLALERVFKSTERPDSRSGSTNVNFTADHTMLQIRKCYSCSTCKETPCKL